MAMTPYLCGGKYFPLCFQSRIDSNDANFMALYDDRFSGMTPLNCRYINNYWWCYWTVGQYVLYPVFNPLGGDASRNPKYCSW
jgi:hypothetical protein